MSNIPKQTFKHKAASAIGEWWQGTHVPPDPDFPEFISVGYYDRHWTARSVDAAWQYFKEHHRWIIGITAATIVALVARRR